MREQNTYFKGDGGSCIDFLIPISTFSFMKKNLIQISLSDIHHMIYTVLKTKFEKLEETNISQF